MCVERGVFFFEYGLYMFCVACLICADEFGVQFALALLFMSKKAKMQQGIPAFGL